MDNTKERQDDNMTATPKKMIPLCILDILRKHTDEEHTLDQKDIIDLLKREHNLLVEPTTKDPLTSHH